VKFQLIFVVQYVDPVQHLVAVVVLEEVLVQVAVAEELLSVAVVGQVVLEV